MQYKWTLKSVKYNITIFVNYHLENKISQIKNKLNTYVCPYVRCKDNTIIYVTEFGNNKNQQNEVYINNNI
jgi:hypothetical protein